MMLRSLRIGATPYVNSLQSWQLSTTVYILREIKWRLRREIKCLFYRALLQKRPMIVRSLLIVASVMYCNNCIHPMWNQMTFETWNQMTFETWNQILFEMRNKVSYENFYFHLSLFFFPIVFDRVYILREINDFWEFLSLSLSLFFSTVFDRVYILREIK